MPARRPVGTAISLLVVVERLANRVRLDRDLGVLVDEHGAERVENGASRIDVVSRRAEADAERHAGFVAGLRCP